MSNAEEYFITIDAIGKFKKIIINKDEYKDISKAKEVLRNAIAIEKKFEILIRNYYDLEKESLCISLKRMVEISISYSFFFDTILSVDTKIMNLLSSARSYIDQMPKDFSKCFCDSRDKHKMALSLIKSKKNNNIKFNFVECLRNHIQHNGLPVHNFTAHSAWINIRENLEHCNIFLADKNELQNDPRFDKKVLASMPDKIDLLGAIREYISALSLLNSEIREQLSLVVSAARKLFEKYINEYSSIIGHEPIGLTALHRSNRTIVDSIQIFLDWDDVRIELEKKNKPMNSLAKQYVTSKLIDTK